MAMVEVVGVGSIMPFMSVASKPEIIHSNQYLQWTFRTLGFSSEKTFLLVLGLSVLAFLILTNFMQAFMHYVKVKFTTMRRHTLAHRLLKGYLSQEYKFFLNRNSYEFVKNINVEIQSMIQNSLILFVDAISRFMQVFLLTLFLFIVNPLSTLGISGIIIAVYGAIYISVRGKLKRLGSQRFFLVEQLSRIVSEAFWGIKEVKLTGCEIVFADSFAAHSKKLARFDTINEVIADIPKFALETAAFSSIMFFVLLTILRSGTFADVAGTVTLYAYAGYRMIPAVQGLFRAISRLKYGAPTTERMLKEFQLLSGPQQIHHDAPSRMQFSRILELKRLQFSYPNTEKPVLDNVNISILANSLVGFAGKTGSGKTTLVDILLGLLSPLKGNVIVDGTILSESNIRAWQRNLAYVPQNIFLANDSVLSNIGFGIPPGQIDFAEAERAARMAQIHDFIMTELPQGYSTEIGERGVRLSGGQRQRIGIARALYRDPSVLVMDEATSALDGQTEKVVMDAIDSLQGTRTIILIAHRLNTLRKCDVIFLLDKGIIIDQGNYQELEARHEKYFRHS